MMEEHDGDTFKIIISTDNHLGYLEKDPIRGNDSFITFEEILKISHETKPDFMLLGGDLFHENRPSVSSLFKCTQLIRKYAYNDRSVEFSIVSDENDNFSHSNDFKYANFNDPNMNVGLPIFTIHGNHDDQIDQTNLCALDLFHASGLINLFGKYDNVERIEIRPILMHKGKTKLAIYGLGAMKNERLHRLFQQNKVTFLRPSEDTDAWFSIFVIHQNRVKHGSTNYIPETFIPDFIDLVFWGHEHDCRIDPEWNTTNEFYVIQPGSSVATSLSEGESMDKYLGILEIRQREFKVSKVKLNTIRPFIMESIELSDETDLHPEDPDVSRKLEQLCHIKVQSMLAEANNQKTGHSDQPDLPLIRLKVDYSGGYEMFSTMRFCQEYVTKVANPKDMLLLHRRKEQLIREAIHDQNVILNVPTNGVGPGGDAIGLDQARVEDMVKQYFAQVDESMKLTLLSESQMGVGVKLCVDKDNEKVLGRVVDIQLEKVQDYLKTSQPAERQLNDEIKRVTDTWSRMNVQESEDTNSIIHKPIIKEPAVSPDIFQEASPLTITTTAPVTNATIVDQVKLSTEEQLREQLIKEFPGPIKTEEQELTEGGDGMNYETMMSNKMQSVPIRTDAPKRGRPRGSRSRGRKKTLHSYRTGDDSDEAGSTMSSNSLNNYDSLMNDYGYRSKRALDEDEDYTPRGTPSGRKRRRRGSTAHHFY